MSTRPQLHDDISRIVTPTFTEATARVFVFGPTDTEPGYVSVYVSQKSNPHLLTTQPIASFSRSTRPRRSPHVVTLADGTEWLLYKGGCGCGSPIKTRLNARRALNDLNTTLAAASEPASQPPNPPVEELVGG